MLNDAETNIALQMPFQWIWVSAHCIVCLCLIMLYCYPPCPARRDPGDLLIVRGWFLPPWLMCVWCVLVSVSDVAAMPSERAVRYRVRQVAHARPRIRVSEKGCQSTSLQPPNIFPERENAKTHGLFSAPACPYSSLTHTFLKKKHPITQSLSLCPRGLILNPFNIKSNFR